MSARSSALLQTVVPLLVSNTAAAAVRTNAESHAAAQSALPKMPPSTRIDIDKITPLQELEVVILSRIKRIPVLN
ncbi:hypothetical protein [Bradyrhizobium sp. B117]|uniref:hypothetical protein n=1 Tax=Bradyrhizobium sp. B117 TaxID=3140246 RepID=UPI003183E8FC